MNKRLRTLGMGASLLAVLGGAAIGGPAVFAQSSPSTPAAITTTAAAPGAYSAFVAKLATTLGITDPAKVDAAITSSLKQMVDDRFKAGDISANEATALKNNIDSATNATGLLGLDDIVGTTSDAIPGGGQDSQTGDHQDAVDQPDQGGNAADGNGAQSDQQNQSGDVADGNGSQGDQAGNGSGAEQDSMPAPSGNATGT